jgi:hypothetical protein
MKKLVILCILLSLMCGCAPAIDGSGASAPPQVSAAVSASPEATAPDAAPVSESTAPVNPSPIPGLKGVTGDDLKDLLWWCDDIENAAMLPIEERATALSALEALQSVQLLDKATADGETPKVHYTLHLKTGETLDINFAGDWVDFGDGPYHYQDFVGAGYPETVYTVMFENPAFETGATYEEADQAALMTALKTSPCPGPVSFSPDSDAVTFWMTGTGYHYNMWFKAVQEGGAQYVFRRFFGLFVCLGEIGADAYASLELARNDQYGTHRSFSVTSDGETIYPPALFVNSMTYHIDEGVYADAFPDIGNYTPYLQSVTLASDFSVWMKRQDKTRYRLTSPDNEKLEGDTLTNSSFDGLPPGVYQAEVYVSTNGNYIEELEQYEYTTVVHYFLVSVQ